MSNCSFRMHIASNLRWVFGHLLRAEERVIPPLLAGRAIAYALVEQGLALLRCVAHVVLVNGILDGDGDLKHLHHHIPHFLCAIALRAVEDHVTLEVRKLLCLAGLSQLPVISCLRS